MPKIILKDQTIASDISLTYPNASGTIARVEDITGTITQLPTLTLVDKGTHTHNCVPGTFSTVTTFAVENIPNNGFWRIQTAFRGNKFTGTSAGNRWRVRWYQIGGGATSIIDIPIATSPLGTPLYDFAIFDFDLSNQTGSTQSYTLEVTKEGTVTVSNTFSCKLLITKFWP